jgi:hypothetical protein
VRGDEEAEERFIIIHQGQIENDEGQLASSKRPGKLGSENTKKPRSSPVLPDERGEKAPGKAGATS